MPHRTTVLLLLGLWQTEVGSLVLASRQWHEWDLSREQG